MPPCIGLIYLIIIRFDVGKNYCNRNSIFVNKGSNCDKQAPVQKRRKCPRLYTSL